MPIFLLTRNLFVVNELAIAIDGRKGKYNGEANADMQPHGNGIFITDVGDRTYKSTFLNGKFDGFGYRKYFTRMITFGEMN